jgi:hypothetical protein
MVSLLLSTKYYYDQIKDNQFTQQAHKCQTFRRPDITSKWENRKICHKHTDWTYLTQYAVKWWSP